MNRHCKGGVKRYPIVDVLGRQQEARILSESDVMRLICSSQLPEAEKFEKWVRVNWQTVKKAIRQTGFLGNRNDDKGGGVHVYTRPVDGFGTFDKKWRTRT